MGFNENIRSRSRPYLQDFTRHWSNLFRLNLGYTCLQRKSHVEFSLPLLLSLNGSSKTDHKLLSHLATHNCICNHLNSTEVQLKFYTQIFYYWFFQQRPILHHE